MPSKIRSLFRRKNASPTFDHAKSLPPNTPDGGLSAPPMMTPLDSDGDSASHSTVHDIYLSGSSHTDRSSDASARPPTASQLRTAAAAEMGRKRYADRDAAAAPRAVRDGRACPVRSREGVPVVTAAGSEHFHPSAVASGRGNHATEGFYSRGRRGWGGKERPKVRPSARCSAFGGAPRYDWMDIETTAAVKIQAVCRRLRTQDDLDARGLSTPGMRNRRARLRSRRSSARRAASADAPFPFSLCGVGLLFGDGTLEDEEVVRGMERRRAAKATGRRELQDAEKRQWRARRKESRKLEEGIEVVESFEEGEEAEGGRRR